MSELRTWIEATLDFHDRWEIVAGDSLTTVFCRGCQAVLRETKRPDGADVEESAETALRDHQAGLIDQHIQKHLMEGARKEVLSSIVTSETGLDAASAIIAGGATDTLSMDAARPLAKSAIAAYLLAPLDDVRFDIEPEDKAFEAMVDRVQELLDRGVKDAYGIVSTASVELAKVADIQATQTHLLRCALREAEEAGAERDRFRVALESAEEDRHPCTALHARIDELRRRIGERHGFLLVGCSRCGDDLISQEPDNDQANQAMELCPRCTSALFTGLEACQSDPSAATETGPAQ